MTFEPGVQFTSRGPVAINVLPQLADSAARVRAAQQLRGGPEGRFRRLRGVRRLLVPVLEDAFERSLALAAGMDARGYGRSGTATPAQRRTTGALMIAGLLGVVVGVYAMLDSTAPRLFALPMLALGTALALAGFASAGRRVERTRYRPDRWRAAEVVVALSAESPAEVDALVGRALAAGGARAQDRISDGPMYGWSFLDPDGHQWELIHMDLPAA